MSLLDRRVRGFRLVDLMALGLLTMLILGVYLAKTIAGRERAEIARIERQITAEKVRIRLLQAEVSHLEQPGRIGHLSQAYLGLGPASIKRETSMDALGPMLRQPSSPPQPRIALAIAPAAAAPDTAAADPAEPVSAATTETGR